MFKKVLLATVLSAMMVGFCACGSTATETGNAVETADASADMPAESGMPMESGMPAESGMPSGDAPAQMQ